MNRIKFISIEGFKSIRRASAGIASLECPHWSRWIGKSNLISFFRLLNYLQSGGLQNYVGEQGGANALLFYGAKRTQQIISTIEFETESGTNQYSLRLAYAAGDSFIFADEQVSFSRVGSIEKAPLKSLWEPGYRESKLQFSEDSGNKTARVFGR